MPMLLRLISELSAMVTPVRVQEAFDLPDILVSLHLSRQ